MARPPRWGALTGGTASPLPTGTYSYNQSVSVPSFGCQSHTNTARTAETGQSASQPVAVCGPARTAALTMGFWQNTNGQRIITGSASTSGTWLRQFAPFQDLSATASPSQVASYVYDVIKAANGLRSVSCS